jgi:tRNA nucleotidyltransferase (CCA-adding enzyme)
MRVARFAARFSYKIDGETFRAMSINLETLRKVSKERIKDELCKTLISEQEVYGLQILLESKVLETVCPLLLSKEDNLCVLPYQMKCFGDLETRLAYLYCYHTVNDVKQELNNLKFSNKEIKRVLFLLNLIDRYRPFASDGEVSSYKMFMAYLKNETPDTWEYTLEQFIQLTTAMGYSAVEQLAKMQNETVLSRREMDINGDDLLMVGIPAGPEIKQILDRCYQLILDKPQYNERFKLLKFVMQNGIEESI